MSRDEVPAEVRALADGLVLAERHRGHGDYSEAYLGLRRDVEAFLASRPAAPATDAEGEKLATALADAREVLLKISAAWWDEDVAACRADKTRELARAYFADRQRARAGQDGGV